MRWKFLRIGMVLLILSAVLVAAGCSDDDDDDDPRTYQVTVTNLTNNQPFSPVAVALHADGYSPWMTGGGATEGLEVLAEGGNNSIFLDEAAQNTAVFSTVSGTQPVGPGQQETFELTAVTDRDLYLTVATMLVNTNDAFAGLAGEKVSDLAVGETMNFSPPALDAGTEANTEAAGTIPGPADGGEGFNTMRDDRDFITVHPGVVTNDDGLATSVLDESYRWDNPVARIVVTRVE